MMKISQKIFQFCIIIFYINLFFISQTFAQISFDVKTTFDEKSELRYYKLAVINCLQNSNWSKVDEIGEDYSLWLMNLKRTAEGDSIRVEFDIDLRTPAMFTSGKHLVGKHICVIYDTVGISLVPATNEMLITDFIIRTLINSNLYYNFVSLCSVSNPFGNYFIQMFTYKFINEIKRQPTALEELESNLTSAKVIVELNNILNKMHK